MYVYDRERQMCFACYLTNIDFSSAEVCLQQVWSDTLKSSDTKIEKQNSFQQTQTLEVLLKCLFVFQLKIALLIRLFLGFCEEWALTCKEIQLFYCLIVDCVAQIALFTLTSAWYQTIPK